MMFQSKQKRVSPEHSVSFVPYRNMWADVFFRRAVAQEGEGGLAPKEGRFKRFLKTAHSFHFVETRLVKSEFWQALE